MHTVFIVFIILFYTLPLLQNTPCSLGSLNQHVRNQQEYNINLAYNIFVALICTTICIGFILASGSVLLPMLAMLNRNKRRATLFNRIKLISFIALTCTICFLIRTALFLYSAITTNSITVIFFVLLEAIPNLGLVYYLRPFDCHSGGCLPLRSTASMSSRSSYRSNSVSTMEPKNSEYGNHAYGE